MRNFLPISFVLVAVIAGCDGCGEGTIVDNFGPCDGGGNSCQETGVSSAALDTIDPSLEPTDWEGWETYPRDSHEWQGMLVDVSIAIGCFKADQCGLALACREGVCGPCTADDQCSNGESCVLDHCVLSENVACTTYSDCGDGLCVLNGYSATPRGNDDMEAYCRGNTGGPN